MAPGLRCVVRLLRHSMPIQDATDEFIVVLTISISCYSYLYPNYTISITSTIPITMVITVMNISIAWFVEP